MKVLWIGGNHLRHLFYADTIQQDFRLAGAIVEVREHMMPSPPEGLGPKDRENFARHFENRDKAEKRHFGIRELPDCPILNVDGASLNSEKSADFMRSARPDVVLIFGSEMVREPLFSALPRHTINLHLGISPQYRGSATLFWPFYFMEPNYAGSTFHYIVSEPDAGDIIHQVTPVLEPGDGIHDVACKTVMASAQDMVKLLKIFAASGEWRRHKQKGTGKNFLGSDFKAEHLRVIYDLFNDDMVKEYLAGRLHSRTPNLVRQF